MLLPQRTADYVLLVERESSELGRVFPPMVSDRFPAVDHKDAEFPKDAPMFCFPKGVSLVERTADQEVPKRSLHCFALTEEDGARVYAANLTFWVKVDDQETQQLISLYGQDEEMSNLCFYLAKSLCVTSHWPFYDNMSAFLETVFGSIEKSKSHPLQFPIERIFSNFIFETPLPPRGRISVNYSLFNQQIIFKRPPPNELPLFCLNASKLFQHISLHNIMILFSCMLTEKRIMFISESLENLTPIIETLNHLLFPFSWRQIFIPVLPKRLIDFVCAPMPFVVGIQKGYLPDQALLSGVVVVDLDNDTILADQEVETIHELPEKSRGKLVKALRKLTGVDMSSRCPASFHISMAQVSECFLEFFVKIMAKYRDYMEAPSEFVVDKFKKEKWINEHSQKCDLFYQFVDTQHFQCFIDDRYETSPSNLEVLLFDEAIDQNNGKSTAFLNDTSNIHKEVHKVIFPFVDDLKETFKYEQIGKFNHKYYKPIRTVPPLFDSSKESDFLRTGLSNVSMKYFTDKTLYSRHFHSLRVRSNKQDHAFREIVQYMRMHQGYADAGARDFAKILQCLLQTDLIETSTSIDQVWKGLLQYADLQHKAESEFRLIMRDHVYKTMYSKSNEVEQELKVLFSEASNLDKKASSGKSVVDDSRVRYYTNKAKLENLEASKSTDLYLNPSEITRKIGIEGERDDSFMKKVQSETSFRTIVSLYQARMPEIIEIVRKLNAERISQCKSCLEIYVDGYRSWISKLSQAVDGLEECVKKMDIDTDLKTFREGKLEFLEMQSRGRASGNASSSAALTEKSESVPSLVTCEDFGMALDNSVSHRARLSDLAPHDRPVKYSLDMWGFQGFQIAHGQAVRGKATVKSLLHGLEDWAGVLDLKTKSGEKLSKSLPGECGVLGSQDLFWNLLLDMCRQTSGWTRNMSLSIRVLSGSLRVLKGVIKNTYHLMVAHRDQLVGELDGEEESLGKAREKRERLFKEYEAQQRREEDNLDDPKASLARIEKARSAFRQADSDYIVAKKSLNATQEKHDISLGNILDLFQDKELRMRVEIKKNFQKLVRIVHSLLKNHRKQTNEFAERINSLAPEADLREFVLSTYCDETSSSVVLKEDELVDFSVHLVDIESSAESRQIAFDVCMRLAHKGECFVKLLLQYIEEDIANCEQSARAVLKANWSVPCSGVCTLSRALESWERMVIGFARAGERIAVHERERVWAALNELKGYLKRNSALINKQYLALLRDVEPMYQARNRTVGDLKKTKAALESAREKLEKIHSTPKQDGRKARLLQKFMTSEESQASKVVQLEAELVHVQAEVERAEKLLAKTKEMEVKRFRVILQEIKDMELGRVDKIREIFQAFVGIKIEHEDKLKEFVSDLNDYTNLIDPVSDITEFVYSNPTGLEPPESVVVDYHRVMSEENEEKEHKALSARTSMSTGTKTLDHSIDPQMKEAIEERLQKMSTLDESDEESVNLASPVTVPSKKGFRFSKPFLSKLVKGKSRAEFDWEERKDMETNTFYYVNIKDGSRTTETPKGPYRRYDAGSRFSMSFKSESSQVE